MTRGSAFARLALAALIGSCTPAYAFAQGLSVDLSAGSVVYDPLADSVGTTNIMGTVRFDAVRGAWVYGTAAAPTRRTDPAWGSFGAGGRFVPSSVANRRFNAGLDLEGHGFLFRDSVADRSGRGTTIDAIPFVSLPAGTGNIELRGGWRGHLLTLAGATERRSVWETGARADYGRAIRIHGEARLVHADEGSFPFVGGGVSFTSGSVQTWATTGKWVDDAMDDIAWGGGISVAAGGQSTLWFSVRQETPDPLYWNPVRRSWGGGITRRLGRGAPSPLPPPRREPGGVVVIRLPVSDAPGTRLWVAGDFNNWQPAPMQRDGDQWVIRLPLAAGAYNYAFRAGEGDWFVPPSVAGRRSDGMGGYMAVLVVT